MLLSKLLTRTHFDSYADFKKNYELHVPEHFNFARDVVDAWAEADPEKRALVWLNDRGERRTFTFREISDLSKQAANFLSSLGLKKGDRILTLLKRNWQYWVTAVACHRMGVVIIPASVQLATKDIVYRVNAAGIRAIIEERARVVDGLKRIPGVKPYPSDANYVLFRLENAGIIWEMLYGRGVLVRDFSRAPGLEDCLRVSIGSREENDAFLRALRDAVMGKCDLEVPSA